MIYDYQVIPAPSRGLKARGVRTTEARFAYAIQDVLNRMAADGWEFQRAETLPSTERAGLTSTTTVYRNILVFRRPATGAAVAPPADLPGDTPSEAPGDLPQDTPRTLPPDLPPEPPLMRPTLPYDPMTEDEPPAAPLTPPVSGATRA